MKLKTHSDTVLNWLSISDIHLGNIRTSADFIIDNLERELFNGIIAKLDLFVIAGDLFDRQLEFNHPSAGRIIMFVDKLLTECSIHNVKLRVLEGTPSHDNKQNKIFDDIFALGTFTCDMKYVDTLSIEYVTDWDIRILYVPDKIRTTVNEVYIDTIELFKTSGLDKVDLAIMHGAFSHQLPPMAKEVYDPDSWLKLVKHWILVGHVHFHSIYKRIAAGGSFDRLVQGEENPKGFLLGTLNIKQDPKKDKIYFIENTGAKKYVTVNCTDLNIEDSLSYIEKVVTSLPNESFVRIRAESGNPIFSNMAEIKKYNLSIFWSSDEKGLDVEEDQQKIEQEEGLESWVPAHIDRANILDIIMQRLSSKEINGDVLILAEKFINLAR